MEARVKALDRERSGLRSEIDSMNEEIELLELEEEAAGIESDIEKMTVEKAVSQDYLDQLKGLRKTWAGSISSVEVE